MLQKYRLEIIALLVVISFCAMFVYISAMTVDAEFAGSDTLGSSKIAELTGIPEEEFKPLVPQWTPPSGEIESALFALQAAVGGIVLGWVLGYWKGQKRNPSK